MLTLNFSTLVFLGEDMFLTMFAICNHLKVSSVIIPQKNVSHFGPLIILEFLLSQEFYQVIPSKFQLIPLLVRECSNFLLDVQVRYYRLEVFLLCFIHPMVVASSPPQVLSECPQFSIPASH